MPNFSSQLLFQRFTEEKMPLVDFLDSFLSLRKLQHVRMILVKKLQEMIRHRENTGHRVRQIHPVPQHLSVGFPDQMHNPCRLACSLTTAVVLPSCCHPPVFGVHGNFAHYLPHLPFCLNYDEGFSPAERGRGPRRPTATVRLQPLRVLQKRDQQEPQWSHMSQVEINQVKQMFQKKLIQNQVWKCGNVLKIVLVIFWNSKSLSTHRNKQTKKNP